MCKGGRVFRPPFLLHRGEAFYCPLGGLANRSDAKTNRPRFRVAEGVHKWIVWAYLLQRVPRPGSAVPLIGRNNMKKKLLALLLGLTLCLSSWPSWLHAWSCFPAVEVLRLRSSSPRILRRSLTRSRTVATTSSLVWRRLRAMSSSSWVSIPRSMPRPISRALTTRSAT